jgi:hypothetical protein
MITYITTASNIHYTITRKELMKLLQQFAKELTKKYPTTWDVNGWAGKQQITDLVKRNDGVVSL